MTSPRLLIVGSIGLDTIETPRASVERVLGGAAVFAASAACYFAVPAVVGVVGDDFPPEHEALLRAQGVDLTCVDKKPGKTFFWHGRYEDDMNNRVTLDTQLGVFGDFAPRIDPPYDRIATVFLANIHPQLQLDVLDAMRGSPLTAADSMNYWIRTTPDLLNKVIQRVGIFFVNDEEARMLTNRQTIRSAADALLSMGPQLVVIKRGDAGAGLFTRESEFFVPALPLRQVVDPTGAGDAFAGGMMGYLARRSGRSFAAMKQAAVAGTVMASFGVEDFSLNRLAHVTKRNIEERIGRIRDLCAFDPIEF
ncbi:MAG: PfkB family carbohydrate kinase [bacterium]